MALAQSGGGRAMAQAWVRGGASWRVVRWGSLLGSSFVLASLFNAAVTNGLGGVSEVPPTVTRPAYGAFEQQYDQSRIREGTNRHLSPATAALADGDDVRAGLLAGNCATQSPYAGQNSWVPLYSRCTDALP
jgi:hypothetical protein